MKRVPAQGIIGETASADTGSGAIAEIASGAGTGGWCAQQFTDEGGTNHWTVGRKGPDGRYVWSAAAHDAADAEKMGLDRSGNLATAGTVTAGTGLRLKSVALLATPIDGLFEYDGANLYFTVGTTRKQVTLT